MILGVVRMVVMGLMMVMEGVMMMMMIVGW